jgi:hypothetical protein
MLLYIFLMNMKVRLFEYYKYDMITLIENNTMYLGDYNADKQII